MATKCMGLGHAMLMEDGPCQTGLSPDQAVKLMEKAIDDALAKANATCPEGCECVGLAIPSAPYCRASENGKFHIWMVDATLDGECDCSKATGPTKEVNVIEEANLRKFFAKVATLPDLPRKPKGGCEMYKEQRGSAGFYYPVCAGTCKNGKCKTIVTVNTKTKRVAAKCSCD